MINRYLLKQAIAESDKTIVQISRIAKVRRSTIYDLASGRQRTCSSDTIRRLCLTLHISADELLCIRDDEDNKVILDLARIALNRDPKITKLHLNAIRTEAKKKGLTVKEFLERIKE